MMFFQVLILAFLAKLVNVEAELWLACLSVWNIDVLWLNVVFCIREGYHKRRCFL